MGKQMRHDSILASSFLFYFSHTHTHTKAIYAIKNVLKIRPVVETYIIIFFNCIAMCLLYISKLNLPSTQDGWNRTLRQHQYTGPIETSSKYAGFTILEP